MTVFSKPGETFDFTYLSLGAGVQSTALLVLAHDGRAPRPDLAIFADTGDEPAHIYDYLEVLHDWSEIPIHVATKGRLSESMIDRQRAGKRFVTVPLYTRSSAGKTGMLRRQCTREFKIEPIERHVRQHLGYNPRQKIRESVRCLMGISLDEVQRLRPSRRPWITHRYPLVELELDRHACRQVVLRAGLPEPQKSACVFCPYRSDAEWDQMREKYPSDFAAAVDFDRQARDMTQQGRLHLAFVHRSCQPLDQVDFNVGHPGQTNLFLDDCDGLCGS